MKNENDTGTKLLDDDGNSIAKISTHLLSLKLYFAGSMRAQWGI